MNVITPPGLEAILTQGGPVLPDSGQDDTGNFASALEDKMNALTPADTSTYIQPDVAIVLTENVDTSLALEETLAAQQAGAPVLQLMIQVDKVVQALSPDVTTAEGEESLNSTEMTTTLPQASNGQTLPKALNGPTAAAQASLPVSNADKRDQQPVTASPAQLVKMSEIATGTVTPASRTSEMSTNMTAIPDAPSASLVGASLSTQMPAQSLPLSQPAARPVPTAVLNAELGTEAWRQSLNQQMNIYTRNGIQNAELRLNPQELGVIRVNMQLNSDQATLHFVSENHQVRAALEAAMPQLRTSLAESGIQLGESSVGAESSSSWEDNGQPARFAAGLTGDEENGDVTADLAEPDSVIMQSAIRPIGINTFA